MPRYRESGVTCPRCGNSSVTTYTDGSGTCHYCNLGYEHLEPASPKKALAKKKQKKEKKKGWWGKR